MNSLTVYHYWQWVSDHADEAGSHRTKDGDRILIAAMDTDHLMNTIRKHLRDVLQFKKMAMQPPEVNTNKFTKHLYRLDDQMVTPETAAEAVDAVLQQEMLYMSEAFLRMSEISESEPLRRKYDEIIKLYLEVTEREAILPILQNRPQLRLSPGFVTPNDSGCLLENDEDHEDWDG